MANEKFLNKNQFLEMAKVKTFTLNEIVNQFDVSLTTARAWSKLPQIEKVESTYPHEFRYKETGDLHDEPVKKNTKGEVTTAPTVQLFNVTNAQLEVMFRKVLQDEVPPLDWNSFLCKAESSADLMKLEDRVKTALMVTMYYKELLINDGL